MKLLPSLGSPRCLVRVAKRVGRVSYALQSVSECCIHSIRFAKCFGVLRHRMGKARTRLMCGCVLSVCLAVVVASRASSSFVVGGGPLSRTRGDQEHRQTPCTPNTTYRALGYPSTLLEILRRPGGARGRPVYARLCGAAPGPAQHLLRRPRRAPQGESIPQSSANNLL